jgi:hypothetical protein
MTYCLFFYDIKTFHWVFASMSGVFNQVNLNRLNVVSHLFTRKFEFPACREEVTGEEGAEKAGQHM